MKHFKILSFLTLLILFISGCKKDLYTDTSFVSSAVSAANLSVMFNITQDNTGLVTITPNGTGAVYYDVYFGDTTKNPVSLNAGLSIKHIYPEGNYQVKLVGHDIKGGTTTLTQALVVAFVAPQNLVAIVTTSNLTVNVSATAKYATFFKIYYGDSNTVNPVPFAQALGGQTVTHTYAKAGTYVVKVLALSGGAETTQYLDTIQVANQINLPVTFEDPNTNYTMSDFGGENSVLSVDPANNSNHVMKSVKTAGAQTWAGVTVGTTLGFAAPIPLTNSNMKMTVRVYSPAAGLDIKLKVDNHSNPNTGLSVETDVFTTAANQWQTLTFDFSHPASGTPAFNPSNTYDLASIFFDFGNNGSGSVFYFDDLQMAPASLKQISLPVTFEDPTVDYTVTDFGGNNSALSTDPMNAANHVMMSAKTSGAQVWAGTTIGTVNGFASKVPLTAVATKMTVKVYSPAAGLDIKLKLDNHANPNTGLSVETDVKTTVAHQWETLTFDFSMPASGTPAWNASNTYDLASIFFDFGNNGTGSVFYWDELHFLSQLNLPFDVNNPNMDPTVTDFGNNASVLVTDPVSSGNLAIKTVKPSGAQTWAGTTMGTPVGFATAIPLTASRTKMTVQVYSPAAGIPVLLKVEDHNNANNYVQTLVNTTKANQWETLTFDFSQPQSGTPAWNASFNYDKCSIFFDFNNAGSGKVFYWNNVIIL